LSKDRTSTSKHDSSARCDGINKSKQIKKPNEIEKVKTKWMRRDGAVRKFFILGIGRVFATVGRGEIEIGLEGSVAVWRTGREEWVWESWDNGSRQR
jgi:hypothetical protein